MLFLYKNTLVIKHFYMCFSLTIKDYSLEKLNDATILLPSSTNYRVILSVARRYRQGQSFISNNAGGVELLTARK